MFYLQMFTQYIPLSVYDLQTWMGAPSIYVYDCSNAGIIVDLFKQFADQHQKEYEVINVLFLLFQNWCCD
jgi:regulator-associated protein of mTOR